MNGITNTQPPEKLLISAQEAAKSLSICPKTLWNFTHPRGTIPSVKIGSRVLYKPGEFNKWIEAQRGGNGLHEQHTN